LQIDETAHAESHTGTIVVGQNVRMPTTDFDAIVIGAGHNGLVCAAYLARAGLSTLLVEARDSVGGTASSERFGGGTVNICNCDHITFRTTPVMDELRLADHGLTYLDVEPAQVNMAWDGSPAWPIFHDVERTLDALGQLHPREVDGYRRYLKAAIPAVHMVFAAANDAPSLNGITRKVIAKRGRGVSTLLRWSRRSAADIMRHYFTAEALQGPAMVTGPMVWGISPEHPGSGLGALTYALRHVGTVGRPLGGSGMVPTSLERAFSAAGGSLRLATRVAAITCEGERVRGVTFADGTEVTAPIVVSACNPHDTFLAWLRNPPASARPLIERWRAIPHDQGYESKIDAIVSATPRLRALEPLEALGLVDQPLNATTIISPSLAEIHRGFGLMGSGQVLPNPGMFLNMPSMVDPSMAPPDRYVFSLETLYTPYSLRGGWAGSLEPRRWLERFASLTDQGQMAAGFLDTIDDWRAMTPDRYEREFHLPAGHATSFSGGPLAALRNANPELTRYQTPINGLYLTGAATFPGAGVWGASGRNAALTVLKRR
jgi:beta-carotene ketolase (CrtO type)